MPLRAASLVTLKGGFSIISVISGKVIHLIPGENDRLILGNGELKKSGRERQEETFGREWSTFACPLFLLFIFEVQ